jgi:phosphoribosylformimino-5-aminoimidazole carboxamide ribotide isomerase
MTSSPSFRFHRQSDSLQSLSAGAEIASGTPAANSGISEGPMHIIPVLDLKAGHIVHARAGRRQDYQPIVSSLTRSSQPVEVAQAFRERFRFAELYLADLDAIAGAPPDLATYMALQSLGFRLWVDAGVRDTATATPLLKARMDHIIAGLETVAGPQALSAIGLQIGTERVVFSLDLKDGQPLGDRSFWPQMDAWSIATEAVAIGIQQIIILDLARVGGQGGTGTEDLCKRLASQYPDVEIVAGGGVRNRTDLQRLQACGVRAALVASALHNGQLRPEDVIGP